MTDALTWTVQQRLELEERAALLRKELTGVEARLARLEAAEAVFREWAEATDRGRSLSGIVEPEPVSLAPPRSGLPCSTQMFESACRGPIFLHSPWSKVEPTQTDQKLSGLGGSRASRPRWGQRHRHSHTAVASVSPAMAATPQPVVP